ncbi:hypothetical protein EXN66_Car005217 [Channa argus]|uniref:Uncharacterized protein n=1 Tax=Channa argus TaxID=215402 RepID=A0A6G1PGZ0_CHAAH|nr:hypothetical protein EXN66_Car005217 [Channa argus]KAK2914730.1 hypothetical protein Q8A73_005324 [Channa argus]
MAGNSLWNCFSNLLDASVYIAGCIAFLVTAFPVAQIIIGALYMYECPAAPAIPVYVVVCGILALVLMAAFALSKLLCPAAPDNNLQNTWILILVLFAIIWFLYGSYQVYSIYQPNYDKNLTDTNSINNSMYSTTLPPDNRLSLTLENQNQRLSNLNRTSDFNNNQTLIEVIQALALSNINSKTKGKHLMAPQVPATVPYCDRTVYLLAFWTTTLVYVVAGNILLTIICLVVCMKISVKFVELVCN